jgi:HEAT repeat protein
LRELLYQALTRLAVAHPQELVRVLGGQQEQVLLEAARLAGQVRVPAVVPALGARWPNTNRNIRQAAGDALSANASPGAMQQLEKAIDDQDREVRIAAVRALSGKGHRAAFPKIEAAVMGKALKTADLTEKMVFFEAYGTMAGPQGIAPLNDMLNGKGFMKRKEEPEVRACVAMALGKIGTAEATQALEAAAGEKDPLVAPQPQALPDRK